MNFCLKIKFFHVLLLVSVVLFAASVAQAGTSHHHHGKTDAVSPFDKVHKDKSLHCILNLHEHFLNTPCPHKGKDGKSVDQSLRADCGSSSGSANSSNSSFAKNLFRNATYYGFTPLLFASKVKLSFGSKNHRYPRSIDHPPQFA